MVALQLVGVAQVEFSNSPAMHSLLSVTSAAVFRPPSELTGCDDRSAIERGIEEVLTKPKYLTPDVSGKATTQIVGKAIADTLGK
jgi:hypothetical protein